MSSPAGPWYAAVQWGTVPQWVSGAATAIASTWALTLYILSRRSSRRSQSDMVFCHYDRELAQAVVNNQSDRPIVDVSTYALDPWDNIPGGTPWLDPGGSLFLPYGTPGDSYDVAVQFTDQSNQRWQKRNDNVLRRI